MEINKYVPVWLTTIETKGLLKEVKLINKAGA